MDTFLKRKYLMVIIALSIVFAVVGRIVLPAEIVVQFATNGTSPNTLPRFMAVFVPFLVTFVGALLFSARTNSESKFLFISVVGIILQITSVVLFVFTQT